MVGEGARTASAAIRAPWARQRRRRLRKTVTSLERLASTNGDALPLVERYKQRLEAANLYVESYRRYCWPVQSVGDLKLAPFHLLATEGHVHVQRDHVWHMEKLAEICKASDGLLLATNYRRVDVTDSGSVEEATRGGRN